MTLGWILSGPTADLSANESNPEFAHHGVVLETLDRDLRRCWEIEEVPQKAPRSLEEQQCEEHFRAILEHLKNAMSSTYRSKTHQSL